MVSPDQCSYSVPSEMRSATLKFLSKVLVATGLPLTSIDIDVYLAGGYKIIPFALILCKSSSDHAQIAFDFGSIDFSPDSPECQLSRHFSLSFLYVVSEYVR